jgi:fucose 4-O-acetylase-like acetyltransferase
MKPDFKYSVENFRGIAIIFVMLSHLSTFSTLGPVGRYFYFTVVDATTWFIFISGFLFSHIDKNTNFNYINYIYKKIKFVITPYIILSIPAFFAGLYFQQHTLIDLNAAEYFLWSLSVGGSVVQPMWFIPMIAIFFALSFILNKIRGLALLFLTISLLALSVFSSRPLLNMNPFLGFIHFIGFYLFGITMHTLGPKIIKLSKSTTYFIMLISLLGFLTLLIHYDRDFTSNNQYASFNDNLGIFNSMQFGKLSLLIFVFFILEKFYNKHSIILSYLAKVSFGLFFVHGFYMLIFAKYFSPELPNGSIKFLIELFFIVPGSIVTVHIIKSILKSRSKYVIGC